MVKLTISLPNNTQITLEAEDSEVIREVLGQFLRGMPLDAISESAPAQDESSPVDETVEKGTGAAGWNGDQVSTSPPRRVNGSVQRQVNGVAHQPGVSSANGNSAAHVPQGVPPGGENGDYGFDPTRESRQSLEDYAAFCQSLNPMGDMRRVVVAAEAANRFFALEGVSADDLGELFDLVGWRRANSFTQTLRNAARTKFGWLERIPGRAGRYAATDLGRSITLAG